MENWLKLKMDDQQKSNLSIFIPKSKFGRAFGVLFFIMLFIGTFHIYLSTFSGLEVLFGVTDKNIIENYDTLTEIPFLILTLIISIGAIVYFYKVLFKVIRLWQEGKK